MSSNADISSSCAKSESQCQSVVEDGASQPQERPKKQVSFPEDDCLVTKSFEPSNPWQNVPSTTRAQLAAEYLESCRKHNTSPIDTVLQQIRELPEASIGGSARAPRLSLADCSLLGAAPADALEAVFRKVQFKRLEIDHVDIDDEGAEAIFDMVEYYESAITLLLAGPHQFGIRGWQAASRMIKKSAALTELELAECPLEAAHAVVLARSLRACACRLRALTLQHAALAAEPLHTLLLALKSNTSVAELRLCDNGLAPADAMQIASLLRANTTLQLLDLSNNHIMDVGVSYISSALVDQAACSPPSGNQTPTCAPTYEGRGLAFLILWNNKLTKNCSYDISRAVSASRSLLVLNIGRNLVGSAVVFALSMGRVAVSCLGLQGCHLGPDAAQPLAKLIANHHVQRLDLRDNKLGEVGLQAILEAVKQSTTLTQVDLDVPIESSSLQPDDSSTRSRLVREIQEACRQNESASSPDAAQHRRISLTCHTTNQQQPARRALDGRPRLRSPAPSPACSPTPATCRFTVSRVTPDRESSTESSSPSTPPAVCQPKFRVIQVSEPPKAATVVSTPRKSSSRFSVTRNYDTVYNTALTPSPPPFDNPERKGEDSGISPIPLINEPVLVSDSVFSDSVKVKSEVVADVKVATVKVSDTDDRTVKSVNELLDFGSKEVSDNASNVDMPAKVVCDQSVKVEVKKKDDEAIKQIAAITQDLGNLIEEMRDLSHKTAVLKKTDQSKIKSEVKDKFDVTNVTSEMDKAKFNRGQLIADLISDKTDLAHIMPDIKEKSDVVGIKYDILGTPDKDLVKNDVKVPNEDSKLVTKVPVVIEGVVLKKNKSESSLDSPDLEVSRLMNKKSMVSPFCDSSSSLEISTSSVESLNDNPHEKLRAKPTVVKQTAESDTELDRRKAEYSTESSIESTTSDVTPVNCGNFLNTSVSSTESVSPLNFSRNVKIHGSLSSLEASVSSLDSGKVEKVMVMSADSGIEYSLQNTSETKDDSSNEGTLTNNSSLRDTVKKQDSLQDTLTTPKRTASLLDAPAKVKNLDRVRKISWVAPSSSFHIPKAEPEKVEYKLPSHLEKLLSIFQHPSSIFSRSTEEERKSASSTPPRKDSSLTSPFWSWGALTVEKDDDKDSSSPEMTDSTLSERIQVSFVDESFSKKLDSKTPSTDTDNTLSEFPSLPVQNSDSEVVDTVTTELVQIDLSKDCNPGDKPGGDKTDLMKPNDLIKDSKIKSENEKEDKSKCEKELANTDVDKSDDLKEAMRPKSFAAVLKASGSENSQDKLVSPETGQPIDKLPSKVVRGIKENISPDNTVTSSITITKALAQDFAQDIKMTPIVATIWDIPQPVLAKSEFKSDEVKVQIDLAPIANIDETFDEAVDNIIDSKPTSDVKAESLKEKVLDSIDLGKDALSYLMYENQDFDPENEASLTVAKVELESLAEELKEAELKEKLIDLSPELVVDDKDAATTAEAINFKSVLPVKLKKSNSLEDILDKKESSKAKTIAFQIPESTTPRDIPDRRRKMRSRTGSSPKSLPESLNKPCPKMESLISKKKKKVSSLGKIARDSLLALNMTEDEIAEFRRSYKLTSVESLRSLESVSEDANSQSGNSVDSRCRACVRTSQESLMSLDSMTDDCKCHSLSDKEQSTR